MVSLLSAQSLDTIKTTFGDGSLARVYTVKKGTDIREGISLSYSAKGKLAVEVPYKDGKMEGTFKSYIPSGKLREQTIYKNGKESGVSEHY